MNVEQENLLIGRNTVREAIRSGRGIEAVFVAQEAPDGSLREILRLAKDRGIVVKKVARSKLDELARPFGYGGRPGNHQGIVAQVAAVKYAQMEDVFARARQKGQPPFIIALDGVTDPHNLGAVVRSAEVLGAHGVVIPKRRSAGMTAAACKTASGAQEYIPIVRVGGLVQTIEEVKARGVWVACADMSGQSAFAADLTGPLMLVIGAEGEGVSRLVREKCDLTVKVDVCGQIDSLNASAAAAVLMYEKTRQEALAARKGGRG